MELDSRHTASVSINGESIRRIREDKRLTQLYVAKVVGVTTDTVSRWENNRYPTIRRDNALKLAEALEVELDEILKQEDPPEEVVVEEEAIPRKRPWPLVIVLTILLLLVIISLLSTNSNQPPQIQAKRFLAPYAAPGSRVLIRVQISSDKPLKGMILREEFPVGWKLVASEPPASSLDNEIGKARWIFRKPQLRTAVAYLLEVPKDVELASSVELSGELIANPDGQRTAIPLQTDGKMEVQPLHWADTNGNLIIEDLEILEVSNLLDETGQLHLDWDRIESIWDAGGYQWHTEKAEFVPLYQAESPPESKTSTEHADMAQ
ncbi:MAG: helix-turn-helix transcriptional regulator [Desulfuromusa sp.]|nr:helix-turn-helix transcriptional regulator [Desulfuromusa sp.]